MNKAYERSQSCQTKIVLDLMDKDRALGAEWAIAQVKAARGAEGDVVLDAVADVE